MTTAIVPVTISNEVQARVEELGLRRELETILEHARNTIPGLRFLNVSLERCPEMPDSPKILIDAHRPHLGDAERDAQNAWTEWELKSLTPNVLAQVTLLPFFEGADER